MKEDVASRSGLLGRLRARPPPHRVGRSCCLQPVDGLLLCEVGLRLPHVPGTVTFVPFESLEKGGVMVRFEQDDDGDGEFEELLATTFTAR